MKTLTGLNTTLKDLDGLRPVVDGAQVLPMRKALATCLSRTQAKDPIAVMDIALRLYRPQDGDGSDQLELEDAEFKLLQQAVEEYPYNNLIKAQLQLCLKKAETPLKPVPQPSEE